MSVRAPAPPSPPCSPACGDGAGAWLLPLGGRGGAARDAKGVALSPSAPCRVPLVFEEEDEDGSEVEEVAGGHGMSPTRADHTPSRRGAPGRRYVARSLSQPAVEPCDNLLFACVSAWNKDPVFGVIGIHPRYHDPSPLSRATEAAHL
jgi:hypothetical protein